jgi:ketosteroid isomerase-like protein
VDYDRSLRRGRHVPRIRRHPAVPRRGPAEFDDARTDADEYIDAGDDVVDPSRFSGRGKRSGIPVEFAMTIVYTVRDERIVRARNFEDRAEAMRAAGLPEQRRE